MNGKHNNLSKFDFCFLLLFVIAAVDVDYEMQPTDDFGPECDASEILQQCHHRNKDLDFIVTKFEKIDTFLESKETNPGTRKFGIFLKGPGNYQRTRILPEHGFVSGVHS